MHQNPISETSRINNIEFLILSRMQVKLNNGKKIKSNQILETEIVSWRRSFRSQRNPKLNSSEIISWKPISIFSVKRNALLEQKQIGNLIKIGNCMFWYLVEVTGRQHDSLLMTRALLNSIDLGQPELCQTCEQTRLDHRIFVFKWIHSMKPQNALDGAYL